MNIGCEGKKGLEHEEGFLGGQTMGGTDLGQEKSSVWVLLKIEWRCQVDGWPYMSLQFREH